MQLIEGELVVGPGDLTRFLACRHHTRLDVEAARGLRTVPPPASGDTLDLLLHRGRVHVRRRLERLRAEGRSVAVVEAQVDEAPVDEAPVDEAPVDEALVAGGAAAGDPEERVAELRAAEAATVEAMASGVDVVHRAAFVDGAWRGRADFLLRRDGRPGRWPWSYDVAGVAPARGPAVAVLLQLSAHADRLAVLQGVPPESLVTFPGDGPPQTVPYAAVASAARRLRTVFTSFAAAPPRTDAVRVPYCGLCRWQPACRDDWHARDDLTLVAQLPRAQAARLRAAGIGTVAALAAADPAELPATVPASVAERAVHQARLQVAERTTGRPAHRLLPPARGRGLALLPEPSPGDVFFDIEGDPYAAPGGLEYLFGVVERGRYTGYWALDASAQRPAFESLVDHLGRAWRADPGMHVYHYAPYEPTRLKALAGRFDTRVDEVDRLLRGERLVDLYRVVRQGVQVGKESYSLKRLEDHYWGRDRTGSAVADGVGSVIAFERWLRSPDDATLEAIRAYNEDDCRSTQALRDWLEGLRAAGGGDEAFPRPRPPDVAPPTPGSERAAVARSAPPADVLAGDAPDTDLPDVPGADAVARLLAALVGWHRREALPERAEHARWRAMNADELVADPVTLGGLRSPRELGDVAGSSRWEFTFPPQETALAAGGTGWSDPASGEFPGRVVLVDPAAGRLVVDRAAGRAAGGEPPRLSALVPPGPAPVAEPAARLAELAGWVAGHGVDAPSPPWRPARDLLCRRPAPGPLRRPGESAADAVRRLAAGGPDAPPVTAVQVGPGTGATDVVARAVLRAVAAGRTVGLCGGPARVDEVVARVVALAARQGIPLPTGGHDPRAATDAAAVGAALAAGARLVAGEVGLFAAPGLRDRLDLLVVGEAELPLADVLAASAGARSLLLFGDSQRFTRAPRGLHPPGAAVGTLEYLLAGRSTLPPELGILLDEASGVHPRIAAFVSEHAYDGRLRASPGHDGARIRSAGPLSGGGLRWVPVPAAGSVPGRVGGGVPAPFTDDAASAGRQAEAVAHLVGAVLADGGGYLDAEGNSRPLRPVDVLVLAPTHRQAHRVRRALAAVPGTDGVRVEVVDAGRDDPVPLVIYGLAGSGLRAEQALDVLLDPRRLTAALSRAAALAVVVADPALLLAEVVTTGQLLRLGRFAAFVDAAGTVEAGTAPVSSADAASVPRVICGGKSHPVVAAGERTRPLPSGHGQPQPPVPS